MQSYPLKPHYTAQFSAVSFSFHWFPSFYYFHVLSFLQALVCGFQHNSHPFSDCFLCFTHVMGTLVQFTLLLCYICFYMFLGGVGTNSLPGFHRGKIAPGGGRGSRGPRVLMKTLSSSLSGWTIFCYSRQRSSSEIKRELISSTNGRLPI